MAGYDLASIISAATQVSGQQNQQAQAQSDLLTQNQDLAGQQAGLISEGGNLAAQAKLVEQQGQLQTQKNNVQAANSFGTNVGDVSDIITQVGQSMRETAVKLVNAQKNVSDIEAGSDIITNPGGWLKDLLVGGQARAERDALAQQFDTTQKVAQGLNQQTQQTVQTQNAITETLSAASIQQTADASKKLADAKALDSQIQGNAYGANAIQVMRDVGAQEFNRQMQVYNQVTEDSRWKEGFALRQEQFKATQEQRMRGKLDDQYYVEAAGQINIYNKSLGLPEVSANQVRATLNQSGKVGELMRDRQAAGFQIQETGSTAKMLGATPSETMSKIERDRPNFPPSYQPAATILKDSLDLARTEINKQMMDPIKGADLKKDTKAQARIYDSLVEQSAKAAQTNIQSGKGNPYELVPISNILSENPTLAKSNFGVKVLSTLVATGQPSPTPDMIVAMAASSMEKGELNFNEARDGVAEFFAQGVAIKNATGGFLQLGVPLQDGYRTKLNGLEHGLFTSVGGSDGTLTGFLNPSQSPQELRALDKASVQASKPLDLTKPTDVTLALTVMRSKGVTQKILKSMPE